LSAYRNECLLALEDITEVLIHFSLERVDILHFDIASLTFFENVLKIGHTLNICSSDVFVLSKNEVDLMTKFLKHDGISHKKTAVQNTFSEP